MAKLTEKVKMQLCNIQNIDSVPVQKESNLEVEKWLAILYLVSPT